MNRNQIITISFCAVLGIGIYLFASNKKPKDAAEAPASEHQTPAGNANTEERLDIENYIAGVNADIKDEAQKQKIEALAKNKQYKELTAEYQKIDKPLAIAWYAVKLAEQTPTAENYVQAGDYNAILLQTAPDNKARNFLSENMITCYKQAVALDSSNNDNKLRLASAYIEGSSQPMQGVSILLEIVRKDSNNVDAQLLLGRFGIVSGQYDKAIARLEKVLYLQPQNSEAMLMLAEAFNNTGQKQKALDMLERCKKSVSSPELKKEIDNYISSIKKPG